MVEVEMKGYLPVLEPEEGGLVLSFPDLPGCVVRGKTVEEVLKKGEEALASYLTYLLLP